MDSCAQLWTSPVSSTGTLEMPRGTELSLPAVGGVRKGRSWLLPVPLCSAPWPVAEGCRRALSTVSSRAGLPRVVCCGRSLRCCGPVTPTSVQLLPREVKDPTTRKSAFLLSGVSVHTCCIQLCSSCPNARGCRSHQSPREEPSWEVCKARTSGQSWRWWALAGARVWGEGGSGEGFPEMALSPGLQPEAGLLVSRGVKWEGRHAGHKPRRFFLATHGASSFTQVGIPPGPPSPSPSAREDPWKLHWGGGLEQNEGLSPLCRRQVPRPVKGWGPTRVVAVGVTRCVLWDPANDACQLFACRMWSLLWGCP